MSQQVLKAGSCVDLEVVKDSGKPKFYTVKTPDGQNFQLRKFRFQINKPLPDVIRCYIKQVSPSLVLTQDISGLIKDFYETGKEYEFRVKGSKLDSELIYEIEDHRGLCFRLKTPNMLSVGSQVRCKISNIKNANVTLQYVGTQTPQISLDFYPIERWLKDLKLKKDTDYYFSLLENEPVFEDIIRKYKEKDGSWIIELLEVCSQRFSEWLIECKSDLVKLRYINGKLAIVRQLGLYILEESDFLKSRNQEQRSALQGKVSNIVELLEQYSQATTMILGKTHEEYINKVFRKLKGAGYLYHPKSQIRVMMTILKLRPELINPRMGELFYTLHNWDITNWQSEPFRGALVQQLQIFIEENYGKINLLPANDTSSDQKLVKRLVLALAVQRLLAKESDNLNLDLNRSILYRYTSFILTEDYDTLLQKSVESILGQDMPNELVWSDTATPDLLINKLSIKTPEKDSEADLVKTYTTSKVEVQLRRDSLHIIGKDADPETTVIPNDMFDWMNPVVSLADDINVSAGSKTKKIKDQKKLWDNIRWSLFGYEDKVEEKIEKHFPSNNDEVTILIDDYIIDENSNERQRLKFHCTIQDDVYYGEGLLPCDTYHMVGWMNFNSFDRTMRFATAPDGKPLLFRASVRNNDGRLEFSLKNQISDYLVDSLDPGQETVAMITTNDTASNAWIALGENGASYKLYKDTVNQDLKVGDIVRVSYLERDRNNSLSLFFVATLSEDQSDLPSLFNKMTPFCNLMHSLGEIQENDEEYMVVESDEILSQEELKELIYILRRRANAENDYIKAYNYLGLATILARIIDADHLLEELTVHMELIELHHEFGKNKTLSKDSLLGFEEKVLNSAMLERLYTRLKIVADLDFNENEKWLLERKHAPRNAEEGQLASLVLAYNYLPTELESSKKQIMNQIATLLNVNSATINSKYYGDESQTVEFKSSLVFSPAYGSRPAVKEQLWEITHVICGFLNARGGKLYIGVNDSGYENGLDDDLLYRKQNGLKASIDGICTDLKGHLDRTLSLNVSDHIEISSDPDSKKGVIIVKILPVRQPVELDGVIYVRSSSVTKPRYNEEREEFIKNRPHNYDKLIKLWEKDSFESLDISDDYEDNIEDEAEELPEVNLNDKESSVNPVETIESETKSQKEKETAVEVYDRMSTGKRRKNQLYDDYQGDFVVPAFYVYFKNNDAYSLSEVFNYKAESESRLILAVKENEKNDLLVLTSENDTMCIQSLDKLASEGFFINHTNPEKRKLKGAYIARPSDYLLSVLQASNGALFYRIDSIKNLTDEANDKLKVLSDLPYSIVRQEIVSPEDFSFFEKDAIDRDFKTYGAPVPVGNGTLSDDERIDQLLTPVSHIMD